MTQQMRRIAARTYTVGNWVAWLLVVAAVVKGYPHHGVLFVAQIVFLLVFTLPTLIWLTHRRFAESAKERIASPAFAVELEEQRRAR
jgi:hypothetical protein